MLRAFSNKVLSVPKGFGKFYPNGVGKAAGEAGSGAKTKVNVNPGGGGSGGGGGRKPDKENQWMKLAVGGGSAVLITAVMLMSNDGKSGRCVFLQSYALSFYYFSHALLPFPPLHSLLRYTDA